MAMRAGLVDVGERRRLRVRTRSDSDGISTNVFVLTDLSNPKGCQKVAGGRSPRRPPEKSFVMTAPRRGARRQVNLNDLYARIWHPSGVRPN